MSFVDFVHWIIFLLRARGRVLACMLQGVGDQVNDVLIGQAVENVLAVPSTGNQVFGAQDPQALGDRGESFLLTLRQFRDAGFALGEQGQQAKPGQIADGAEQPGRAVESGVTHWAQPIAVRAVILGTAGGSRGDVR